MTAPKSKRETWWYWAPVQHRLALWTKALLKGRKFSIRLDAKTGGEAGYTDWEKKVIMANPGLWPGKPVATQFRATQGILAHEVGHVLFTTGWKFGWNEQILAWLSNALEDERMERAISIYYPGVAPAIRLTGDLMWEDTASAVRHITRRGGRAISTEVMMNLCLAWRWAHSRSTEGEMLAIFGASLDDRRKWVEVRPLVEEAWTAPNTEAVIAIARRILDVLDIPPDTPFRGIPNRDIQRKAESDAPGDALPFPKEASDGAPGLGVGADEDALPDTSAHAATAGDPYVQFSPYTDIEDAVRADARRLAEAVKIPQPRVRTGAHEWRGRYSFRQELRTPDTPNRLRQQIGKSGKGVAVYVLVDRSGSMSGMSEAVRRALMTIYLALTDAKVPVGIAYFGHRDGLGNPQEAVLEVTLRMRTAPDELDKSLIAGYVGRTGAEYLHWGLTLAEKRLERRPERKKIILVVHDGYPVYHGRHGDDESLSTEDVKRLERKGIVPLGVFLGSEERAGKLQKIFPRIVATDSEHLADKLGRMLRSLL